MVDWLQISQTEGEGDAIITLTASSYTELEDRMTSLTVSGSGISRTLSITQKGFEIERIYFDTLSWAVDVPLSGGTADKDNCLYTIYAENSSGIIKDITNLATVSGSVIVEPTEIEERHSAGTLTLTASFNGISASQSVTIMQGKYIPENDYLYFEALENNTKLTLVRGNYSSAVPIVYLEYSLNGSDWKNWNKSTTLNKGDVIRLKGINETFCGILVYNGSNTFNSTKPLKCGGNVMSILGRDTLDKNKCLAYVFFRCPITTPPILPSTSLTSDCYHSMFGYCTSLTTVPELPATELADGCYDNMFTSCPSIVGSIELPATELADDCYYHMFYGSSIITAPELPATELAYGCYDGMFQNCASLTTAPELPATELAGSCYRLMFSGCTSLESAPELPATELADSCYESMFQGCTSLVNAPEELPATSIKTTSYSQMFEGCTSLESAPELPAFTLGSSSAGGPHLWRMFYGCSSLNYIKCLANPSVIQSALNGWTAQVSLTGTFVKATGTNWPSGDNGIPIGWTVLEE